MNNSESICFTENIVQYKGYAAFIDYDAEDGFYGSVLCIQDVLSFEGATFEDAVYDFYAIVDDYLEWCEERGKTPNSPIL